MIDSEANFIKLVDGWGETKFGPNMQWLDGSSDYNMDKIAKATGVSKAYFPPEMVSKIAEIKRTLPKGKVAFYNRALGSDESYGLNKNGDSWERHWLMKKHATFVDGARYYRNHKNKAGIDPDFGRPGASAFNTATDMVDLIIVADFDKQAEEDIQAIEKGESIFTSMGCRVKFDVCRHCGNQARNPGEYCEHVKEAAAPPFGMCSIQADGSICGVRNPDPNFFDISRVRRPAFVGSENLMKVASTDSGLYVVSSAKLASMAYDLEEPENKSKIADMIKEIPGKTVIIKPSDEKLKKMKPVVASMCSSTKSMSKEAVDGMVRDHGLDAFMSTTAALGIVLTPDEFGRAAAVNVDSSLISSEKIAGTKTLPSAMALIAGPVDRDLAKKLAVEAGFRTFNQPGLLSNMRRGPSVKVANVQVRTASAAGEELYLQYRSALASYVASGCSPEHEKTAAEASDTGRRLVTESSVGYAILAFCHDTPENKSCLSTQLLAKVSSSADNLRRPMFVSGSVADEFGEEILEELIDQFLTE